MCFCPPVQTLLKEIIIDMFKIYIYIFVHVLIQVRYKQKIKGGVEEDIINMTT